MARPAHRQSACRIELAGQNVGDGVSRLAAQKPGREHRVGALEQPRQSERPARGERGDDRFAKAEDRFGERALAPWQAEIGPARRLSAHRRALAKAQHDDFGFGAQIGGGRYSLGVFSLYVDAIGVIDAAFRHGRPEPIKNGHNILGAARRSPGPQHLARRRGQRPDDGDAPDRGGERQDFRAVGHEHDRPPRRLSREFATFRDRPRSRRGEPRR